MSRILVIDDQADVRAMIAIVLRVHHFEIVEADSAAAGLKAFENSSFDLAIVDIFLQGTNGFDFITMMRERSPEPADRGDIGHDDARLRVFVAGILRRRMSAEAVSAERSGPRDRSGEGIIPAVAGSGELAAFPAAKQNAPANRGV